jgi:hypothetical protein
MLKVEPYPVVYQFENFLFKNGVRVSLSKTVIYHISGSTSSP